MIDQFKLIYYYYYYYYYEFYYYCGCARVCVSLRWCVRVCTGVRGCAWVCTSVCGGMCVQGYARVCVGMRRGAQCGQV